jgi:glutaconate CoA-transferase subunit A
MEKITDLKTAINKYVHDGWTVVMEGFTHLIPLAAAHEIIRQQKMNLTLVRLTPDIIYDQLIAAGCCKKLIFSWAGNIGEPGNGSECVPADFGHRIEFYDVALAAVAISLLQTASIVVPKGLVLQGGAWRVV